MIRQQFTRKDQQTKNQIPLVDGILQRTAVHCVAENELQPTQEIELPSFTGSRFHHDFSKVPTNITSRQAASISSSEVIQMYRPQDAEIDKPFLVTVPDEDHLVLAYYKGRSRDNYIFEWNRKNYTVTENNISGLRPTVGGLSLPSAQQEKNVDEMEDSQKKEIAERPKDVISGHGRFNESHLDPITPGNRNKSATFVIPNGVELRLYAPPGAALNDIVANRIEELNPPAASQVILRLNGGTKTLPIPTPYPYIFTAGEQVINYTVTPPDGLNIKGNPYTVSRPTPLREIVENLSREGPPVIHYACCGSGYSDQLAFKNLFTYRGYYVDLKKDSEKVA